MAKTWPLKCTRILAAGLISATLASPLAASTAVRGIPPSSLAALPELQIRTIRVASPRELLLTLYSDFTGRVIIPADAQWDLSGFAYIPLRSGVVLLGERGPLGSRPLLYTTMAQDNGEAYPLFHIAGNDVRVEGIHFRGSMTDDRTDIGAGSNAISVVVDAAGTSGRRVLITDNEFDHWTGAGVEVYGDLAYRELPASQRKLDAGQVRVERSYFHHNTMDGEGYGVSLRYAAFATVEGNVFEFNRHDVQAAGHAGGYIARFNYCLNGGYTYGSGYYGQHFDAHGTNGGYGGKAGDYFEIAHNTIRGEQTYYVIRTRPAFELRGKPTDSANFNYNIAVHDDLDGAVALKNKSSATGIGEHHDEFNFHAAGNTFDTDYSTEVATGDFDGDGRMDVFVANGTAWFYSRAGIRPWEFLHASNKRTHELGFADIDNDGRTDVLYRDPSGNVGWLKSGSQDLQPLTTSPVLMKDLRFGDFDGDRKTDIFYTQGGQWYIWYGSTRTWTFGAGSSQPLPELLFGEFDNVRGTDVAGRNGGKWSYSSGAVMPWAVLNAGLGSSLAGAVAADFDGNGKTDIAFNDDDQWRWSRDGRSALALLRDDDDDGVRTYPSLKSLLIGPFDGGLRAKVISFNRVPVSDGSRRGGFDIVPGERLVIWNGPGGGDAFRMRSEQNMR